MRVIHDETIMELTRRIPEVEPMCGYDYAAYLDIAAAAIKAAQEIKDAE